MKPPKVSIILPAYNRAATLKRSIDSVLDQTFTDFELIIIDDGSTDETREIIKDYIDHDKIVYIYQHNTGAATARNRGVREAKGDLVAFQDSDDEWYPDKLTKQIDVMEKSSDDVAMVYSDMVRILKNNTLKYHQCPDIVKNVCINPYTNDYQVFGIGLQTTLIKKETIVNVGLFDERLPRFIDLELFIRIALQSECIRINEPLVKYYQTQGITSNYTSLAQARLILFKKYHKYLNQSTQYLSKQAIEIADAYWKANNRRKASEWALTALKTDITNWRIWMKYVFTVFVPHNWLLFFPYSVRNYFNP